MSALDKYKSERRIAEQAPERGVRAEEEDEDKMVVRLGVPVSNQSPVSVLGWSLALVAGAALWAMLYLWLAQ